MRFGLRSALLLVAIVAVGVYGKLRWDEYCRTRIAEQWVAACIGQIDAAGDEPTRVDIPCPTEFPANTQLKVLVHGALNLDSTFKRRCCLKILAEMFPAESAKPFLEIALRSRDPKIQIDALHLLAMHRKVDYLDQVWSLVEGKSASPDPDVRAAAIDCVGFTRLPAYSLGTIDFFQTYPVPFLDVAPAILFQPILEIHDPLPREPDTVKWKTSEDGSLSFDYPASPASFDYGSVAALDDFPRQFRARFEQFVIARPTQQEFAAAARSLLTWPPSDHELRYAEWGVWISASGKFQLARSVIDEIPSFVHQTGNQLSTFRNRLDFSRSRSDAGLPTLITKPVIHLTSAKPMVVDLEIMFTYGRPWFAYPRPDDFALDCFGSQGGGYEGPLRAFKLPEFGRLSDPREGYPWIWPHHRLHGAGYEREDAIQSLGLHWQSLIVSPERMDWMALPDAGNNLKYGWWSELRKVSSSWISNGDESERFLYYDGPTNARPAVKLSGDDQTITVKYQAIYAPSAGLSPRGADDAEKTSHWPGVYVDVADGSVTGYRLSIGKAATIDLGGLPKLSGDETRAALREMIIEAGLNDGEADGLMRCWEPAFFQTNGRRVVYLLSRAEYDLMCPMRIRPEPVESARLVWC